MALRAGYFGIKKTLRASIEKLISDTAGMKIIKTIGNGLSLSAAGKLSANIDSDTMEFVNGKLAAKVKAEDIVTGVEVDTGAVYGNDKIYSKSYSLSTVTSGETIDTITGLKRVIKITGSYRYEFSTQNEWRTFPEQSYDVPCMPLINATTGVLTIYASQAARDKDLLFTLYYTKTESESE